jgi:hypothetical protein
MSPSSAGQPIAWRWAFAADAVAAASGSRFVPKNSWDAVIVAPSDASTITPVSSVVGCAAPGKNDSIVQVPETTTESSRVVVKSAS